MSGPLISLEQPNPNACYKQKTGFFLAYVKRDGFTECPCKVVISGHRENKKNSDREGISNLATISEEPGEDFDLEIEIAEGSKLTPLRIEIDDIPIDEDYIKISLEIKTVTASPKATIDISSTSATYNIRADVPFHEICFLRDSVEMRRSEYLEFDAKNLLSECCNGKRVDLFYPEVLLEPVEQKQSKFILKIDKIWPSEGFYPKILGKGELEIILENDIAWDWVKFEKDRIPKSLTIQRSQFAHFNPYQFLSSEIAKPFHAMIEIVTEPRIIFEPKEEETTSCLVKIKSATAQTKFFPKIDKTENFFRVIIQNDLKFDKIGWKSATVEIKRSLWHSFNVHAHLNEMALYYDVEVEMPDVKPEPAQDDFTIVVIKMLTPEPKKDRFPLLINNGEINIRVLNDIPGPLVKMVCQNGQYQPGMDEFVLVKFTRSGWLDTKTCLCLSNGDDIIFQSGQVEVLHRLEIDDDTQAGTIITISVQEIYGYHYPKQDPNFDSIKIAVGLDKDYVSIPSEIIVMSSDVVAKGGIYIDIKRLEDFDLSEHIEPTIGKIGNNKLIIPFNLAQLFQSSNQEHVINNKLFLTRSGKKVIKLENNRCKIVVKNDTVKIRLARTYRHPEVKQSDCKIMLEVQTNCLGRVLVVRCIQLGYLCEFKDNERILSIPVSQEPMDDVGQDLVISVHKKIEGTDQVTGEIHDSDCLDACQVHLLWDLKPIELTLAVDESLR